MQAIRQFFAVCSFEFSYQLRNPVLWVSFALFFLLTFGAVTIDQIQIGDTGNTNSNSPYAINQITMVMGIISLFAVTAFVANTVTRDDETGYGPILRATRLQKVAYLYGRFTGAWLAAATGFLAVPLAILIGSAMPWMDPEKLGPLVLTHYAYGYTVIALPMLFVFGAMLFVCATLTRSMMGAYLGLIAILVAWVTVGILLDKPDLKEIAALVDPTGSGALFQQAEYWTAADRNTRLPAFDGVFLQNRAIWGGVALVCLGLAYVFFRPGAKGVSASKVSRTTKAKAVPIVATAPAFVPALTASVRRSQLWARTVFDVKSVLFSPAFVVLLLLGMFNASGALFYADDFRGTPIEPVTRLMVGALYGAFAIIPIIIAGFYAGDLVWRDRERRMAEIIDATPVSDWAFVLPKVLAILLVLLSANVVAMFTAMGVQLIKGYTNLEPLGYLLWWIIPSTMSAMQLACLAVFLQAVSPNKYVGWGLLVIYLVLSITLNNLGFQHNLYNFGSNPQVPLSAFNGMGHFWIGRTWFDLYWNAFCIVLVILSYGLWRRGAETRLRPRLARFPARMRGLTGLTLGGALVAFVGLGGWIFYNTNILNVYQPTPEQERELAEAEKALARYEEMPGPTIISVKLDVNLRPKDRQADVVGNYVIENQHQEPLTHMIAALPQRSTVAMAEISVPDAQVDKAWPAYNVTLYRFTRPLAPGERRVVEFKTTYGRLGFSNSGGQTRLVANGTFLDNSEFTPVLGILRAQWMTDRAKRRKYGLDPDRRPFKLEDPKGDRQHYLRPDSHWVTADITVTTDADQIPIAPGYQISESLKNGRITRRFVTEAPIQHFFSIQSARYGLDRSSVMVGGKPVAVELYHYPTHSANLDRMEKAAHRSLTLFSERFSPYQFRQFRILEFPGYQSFAQSFANTVPFSEDIGWLQTNRDPEKVDLVTFVTAHEIAHQWFAHQIIGGDKQGATMLSETFAQYGAMLVMEDMMGKEQVRQFLKAELDAYLRARGSEVVEELPLMRVENQPYIHYRKGALVMYFLRNEVGEEPVNAAIRRLITQFAFKSAPYPTSAQFVAFLREEVGPDPVKQQLITDLFEKITLYDAKTLSATKTKLADGRWQVSLSVEAKKLYADGEGKETEAPMSEAWEVGVFTKKPAETGFNRSHVLAFERKTVRSGRQEIVLTLPAGAEPAFAGIDPYVKRIDRNSDDNLVAVEAVKSAK